MLQITIPGCEYYDEETSSFITTKDQTLQIEHSLVSLSKWESKWEKPFLASELHTVEESIDYIRCMTITQNVASLNYRAISQEILDEVNEYISKPMSATWFSKSKGGRGSREIVTAELIYYWMIALNIPFECQKWHLNRLMTLIEVCNIKNGPQKKMSKRDTMSRNRTLNAIRRQQMQTKG
jgi:hypothetical protein